MKKIAAYVFFLSAILLMFTRNAYAYIDPASTSYLFQIVAGVVIACGAALGIFWTRIKKWFAQKKLKAQEAKIIEKAERSEKNEGSKDK